jgi:hypothetical protein
MNGRGQSLVARGAGEGGWLPCSLTSHLLTYTTLVNASHTGGSVCELTNTS